MVKHPSAVSNSITNRRESGRLRNPRKLVVKRPSDFSTSFTQKVKMNNDTLARTLAKSEALNGRQADEIKFLKSTNSELLMKMYSEEARHKECYARMEAYIVKNLNQTRGMIDTFITMQAELSVLKADESIHRRFPSEPSQQRVSGSTQTQSVGPMVQGHSIKQPRISLSRINPWLQIGGCVPPAPQPVVPASADAVASPNRRRTAAAALDAPPAVSSVASAAEEAAPETMDMFYARVHNEDPQEGSSSGKRRRIFQPSTVYPESSDEDDDDDFEPGRPNCDRTSYSPTNMEITLGSKRLSTILQEGSPLEVAPSVPRATKHDTKVPKKDSAATTTPKSKCLRVQKLSPIEPWFHGFVEPEADARDRSLEELHSPPWNGLGSAKPAAAARKTEGKTVVCAETVESAAAASEPRAPSDETTQVTPVPQTPVLNLPAGSGESVDRPAQSNKKAEGKPLGGSCSPDKTKSKAGRSDASGGEAKSAPSRLTKRVKRDKQDPDWTPLSEPSRDATRVKRKPLKARRVDGHGSDAENVENAGNVEIGRGAARGVDSAAAVRCDSRGPRVVVNRMDPVAIKEAMRGSSLRTANMNEEAKNEDERQKRPARRAVPASYKEPSLNVKMRRS